MSKMAKLDAAFREEAGKGFSRRTRQEGRVPAVMYGSNIDTVPLTINEHEMARVIQKVGSHAIIELEVDGAPGKEKKHTVMVKDIQRNPLRDDLIHVDFQKIALDEEIDRVIPIHVNGTAAGTLEGGVQQYGVHEITLRGIARDIPEFVETDVSELMIGDAIRVADLELPSGMQSLSNPDEVVVSIVAPRLIEEEEVEGEEVEGEEGEMAEPELIGAKTDEEEEEE